MTDIIYGDQKQSEILGWAVKMGVRLHDDIPLHRVFQQLYRQEADGFQRQALSLNPVGLSNMSNIFISPHLTPIFVNGGCPHTMANPVAEFHISVSSLMSTAVASAVSVLVSKWLIGGPHGKQRP